MMTNDEFGLYVHIPVCLKKCRYCDFYSLVPGDIPGTKRFGLGASAESRSRLPVKPRGIIPDALVAAISSEIERSAVFYKDMPLKSVFFGGGTPSLLEGGQFASIMQTVYRCFSGNGELEVSLEANPGSIDRDKLDAYVEAGLNRLSLGVQSMNEAELGALGRIHSPEDVVIAVELLKKAGLSNFNLDIMMGIPGQSETSLKSTLEKVLSYNPAHISAYILQLEEDTTLAGMVNRGEVSLPDEEQVEVFYQGTVRILQQGGLCQYEISNFALPGRECVHNMIYWQAGQYMGVGPGAVSLLGDRRYRNDSPLQAYMEGQVIYTELERMSREERIVDAVILGLRLIQGIDPASFNARFGISLADYYRETISRLRAEGLLEWRGGRLCLTARALLLSNQVFMAFLP